MAIQNGAEDALSWAQDDLRIFPESKNKRDAFLHNLADASGEPWTCDSILVRNPTQCWLYVTALCSVPAALAGSYFNVIPVFGIGLAHMFLGETLTFILWGGVGAILISGNAVANTIDVTKGTRASGSRAALASTSMIPIARLAPIAR